MKPHHCRCLTCCRVSPAPQGCHWSARLTRACLIPNGPSPQHNPASEQTPTWSGTPLENFQGLDYPASLRAALGNPDPDMESGKEVDAQLEPIHRLEQECSSAPPRHQIHSCPLTHPGMKKDISQSWALLLHWCPMSPCPFWKAHLHRPAGLQPSHGGSPDPAPGRGCGLLHHPDGPSGPWSCHGHSAPCCLWPLLTSGPTVTHPSDCSGHVDLEGQKTLVWLYLKTNDNYEQHRHRHPWSGRQMSSGSS